MKKNDIFIGALGVCAVLALVVGFAGASAITPHISGANVCNSTAHGQGHGGQSQIIEHLAQQGVDVSVPQTALRNGDTAAVKTWLDAYQHTNPRNESDNRAVPDPGKLLERLSKQGVDVSTMETALQNGDTNALKTWLDAFRASHMNEMRGNTTGGRSR
jgi:hypothetical protein